MQRPDELAVVELVVAGDERARRNNLVAHLLEGVEHVESWGGELDAPVLLVAPLRRGGRLLRQDAELVQRKSVHSAADKEENRSLRIVKR